MQIKSTLKNRSGQVLNVVYEDVVNELDLSEKRIQGVHAYCFCGDKLVLVYSDIKGYWTPPGGGVEKGEDVRSAVRREVKEETNMNVLKQRLIGCQDIAEPKGIVSQTRSVCIVEPYGPFVNDPDGDITRIELIDPKDCKKYFDWGEIGDHILQRALELKMRLEASYKGTIVENSLSDKSILKKVEITRTWKDGDWTLHNVQLDESQIEELSRSLNTGPWYIHVWQPGKDDVKVIYKDKIFDIKFSDKATWVDAVKYGESLGIPEKQLDFPID